MGGALLAALISVSLSKRFTHLPITSASATFPLQLKLLILERCDEKGNHPVSERFFRCGEVPPTPLTGPVEAADKRRRRFGNKAPPPGCRHPPGLA